MRWGNLLAFDTNVVLLVGGVGGAKLAYGLSKIVPPERLTIIVNTGDDFWHYGLRICPDLDTITYTLSGLVDKTNGWGIANDTTITMDSLKTLGESPWFRLGDKDLATHLFRTGLWQEGVSLTEITQRITKSLGISCTILPMTNQPVTTIVETVEYGNLEFQSYFVEHLWRPTVKSISLNHISDATVSAEIKQAIENADNIIIGPSNPWLSINPILSVPGMRELLTDREKPCIAVTPIIDGDAVKGPTAKIMNELNLSVTAETVIAYYGGIINGFVYDERDGKIERADMRTVASDTLMTNDDKKKKLAENILTWLKDWN